MLIGRLVQYSGSVGSTIYVVYLVVLSKQLWDIGRQFFGNSLHIDSHLLTPAFQVFGNIYGTEEGLLRFMRGMHCFAALSAR